MNKKGYFAISRERKDELNKEHEKGQKDYCDCGLTLRTEQEKENGICSECI